MMAQLKTWELHNIAQQLIILRKRKLWGHFLGGTTANNWSFREREGYVAIVHILIVILWERFEIFDFAHFQTPLASIFDVPQN